MTQSVDRGITVVIPIKPGLAPEAVDAVRSLVNRRAVTQILVAFGRNPSIQRNRAVGQATGEFIYFLDNDSLPHPETLVRLLRCMEDPSVAVAGGPSVMPEGLPLGPFLFGKTLESVLCTGSSSARYRRIGTVRRTTEKEVILCNMLMRRDVFVRLGGFNERLYPNEENELMEKIRHEGLGIMYDPDAVVIRMPRTTLRQFIRQIWNYGRGRGEQTVYYPASFNIMNFAPLGFTVFLPFAMLHGGALTLPLLVYATLLLGDAVWKARGCRDFRYLLLPVTSFMLHCLYGFGTAFGLLHAPFKRPRTGDVVVDQITL